jgi:voltage-gated potassium channel Kch
LLIKGLVLLLLGKWLGFERRSQWAFATTLAQGSEFAFVLFAAAFSSKVLSRTESDFLVLLVALSMAVTPLIILLKDRLSARWTKTVERPFDAMPDTEPRVIIAGFGRFGQIVARVLLTQRVPFTALEKSQEQVDFVRRFGNRIYYGDASRLELLRAAKAERAELIVLAIDDVEGSVAAAEVIRKHFPEVRVMARARNRQHAFRLMEMGIEVVIRDTLFSSLKMSEYVLMALGLSDTLAKERVEQFRQLDRRALEEQKEFYRDEARIIESAKNYTKELEQLFETDSNELTRDRF